MFPPSQNLIDKNSLPTQRIHFEAVKELPVIESRLGGRGYWPWDKDYPHSVQGNPLFLLLQINCADMRLPEFPNTGLLQFYIAALDSPPGRGYGISFEKPMGQEYFRIVYHEMAEAGTHVENYLPKIKKENWPIPLDATYRILFSEPEMMMVPPVDYRFEEVFGSRESMSKEEYALFWHHYSHARSRIGGYPYFIHSDPRRPPVEYPEVANLNRLLLQLDAMENEVVPFRLGDTGCMNFLISDQDLAARNFTRVFYDMQHY